MKNFFAIFSILILFPLFIDAQVKNKGIPFIINYSSDDYKASTQNWSIVQDIDKNGRIYVGARGEFGYLKPDNIGDLTYVSLVDKIIDENDKAFRDIGRILIANDEIYFVSLGKIFKYAKGTIEVIKNKKLRQAYEIDNRIFIKENNKGVAELVNGKFAPIPNGSILKKSSIRAILPYKGKYLFVTLKSGLFLYDNNKITKIKTAIDYFLDGKKIISSIQLKNGEYVFGMFSNGLLITDKSFNPIQYLDTKKGLRNNQVYSVYQDNRLNIWLGLANGISEVLTSLPISRFNENYGLTDKVTSSIIFNDYLYVGTSAGTFSKNWPVLEDHLNLSKQFIKIGEPVQVFKIDTLNNKILIAHGLGITTIGARKHNNVTLDKTVVYNFLNLVKEPTLAIAGTKNGLLLLEFKTKGQYKKHKKWKKKSKIINGEWIFKQNIKGFKENCRHIQIDDSNNIWFSSKTKGIAKLTLNKDLDSVSVSWHSTEKGIPSGNKVFNISNRIIVNAGKNLYCYNPKSDVFELDTVFNKILGDVEIELFIEDYLGNIWFKQKRTLKGSNTDVYEMGELIKQEDNGYYLNRTSFYRLRNKVHSIAPVSDNEIIIGSEKGFVHYDSKIKKDHYQPYYTLLREVKFVSNDSIIFAGTNTDISGATSLSQLESQVKTIPFSLNNIRFSFSAPFFDKSKKTKFKYFLDGNDKSWSDWKDENYKEYSNLKEGDYVFRVTAKNIYEVESIEATYDFTILPPWYRTIWAIILYVLAAGFSILGIVRLSVRRLRKQKEYLEMVVKERTAEINQAKEEIEATNEMLQESNEQINAKNKSITASITYAKRIQEAMLPIRENISRSLEKSFILFKPRDIVSGDFYWFAEKNGKTIIAAVDCTGHGVPGAFMSMIGSEILTTIIGQGITQPSIILDLKNKYVHKALKQDKTDNQDGMDMTICTIDRESKIVEFAGAKNPLVYIQNGELFYIKGDKQSIGGRKTSKDKPFVNHEISYAEHETYFYTFSDGFQDQFGGPNNRKYMIKRMKNLILQHHLKNMDEQQKILKKKRNLLW
ncbi:MAG: hypothetical protein B6I20_04830 [Bacteroidetes bacterium 4572_117]|nr:MAG: hypothetical protein B6I20_04830 [Bacteroidetes bacterium 4572_117]